MPPTTQRRQAAQDNNSNDEGALHKSAAPRVSVAQGLGDHGDKPGITQFLPGHDLRTARDNGVASRRELAAAGRQSAGRG